MTIEAADGLTLDDFVSGVQPMLERALVARFGIPVGIDAAADAVEYAYLHWDRLSIMQTIMQNPAGYLFKVGRTRALRELRSRRRLTVLVADPRTSDTPVDVDLQRALVRLPWEQRVAIVLVHAHGHTYADASRIMDLPVTTVTNHLHRGLARLRHILEER